MDVQTQAHRRRGIVQPVILKYGYATGHTLCPWTLQTLGNIQRGGGVKQKLPSSLHYGHQQLLQLEEPQEHAWWPP